MIQEDLVFQQLEDEALGELYDMQQRMHSALAPAFFENEFKDEVGRAWKAHDRVGRLSLPWYKWGPEKSLADAYRAMVESTLASVSRRYSMGRLQVWSAELEREILGEGNDAAGKAVPAYRQPEEHQEHRHDPQ